MEDSRRAIVTKADFVDEISEALEISRKDAQLVFETVVDCIVRALHEGDRVEIRRFGCFRTLIRAPRKGLNPRTGIRVEVPAKRVPSFRPSKELLLLINDGTNGESEEPH